MSFVGYIPDHEHHEEMMKWRKEHWDKMTPEERKAEKEMEFKAACIMSYIAMGVIFVIIAFFAWILLS
jgi:hypothetical protein